MLTRVKLTSNDSKGTKYSANLKYKEKADFIAK